MKKLRLVVVVVFVMVGSFGCAEKWAKPGGTEHDFEAMKSACSIRAESRFPIMYGEVEAIPGHYTATQSGCGPNGCYVRGGEYVPTVMKTVDINEDARKKDMRSCFLENGWQPH